MNIICLDLEGVLVPEIWIAVSKSVGIPELSRTTRDEPNYQKLMDFRLDLLKKNNIKLPDIQNVISGMELLEGAYGFAASVRSKTQLILLSDTFEEFANPLMKKLSWPTLFCNTLVTEEDGTITGYKIRKQDGKKQSVMALRTMNMRVFAAGDSYNDLDMIREADSGCLFRAPEQIRKDCHDIKCVDTYDELLKQITNFLE